MNKIKEYKISSGIGLSKDDNYECGMIGERYTFITTTMGLLEAKRTSCNPNFAAMIIDMFRNANVREGDEVAIVTSGSFPALNISVTAACQVMNLKVCYMASIGASSYGANNLDFTYFDMYQYLYQEHIFKYPLNYVSLGGGNDTGNDMEEDVKKPIIERIKASNVTFIHEDDYETNVKKRKEYILKACPNLKLFINVGGSLVSMGRDEASFIDKKGLVMPNYLNRISNYSRDKLGLIDIFLEMNVPIIQILNIKGLALQYGISYNPTEIPSIGSGDMYYQTNYNLMIPIIGLVVSVGILVFYLLEKFRKKERG